MKYFSLFILILLLTTRLSKWAADRENLARHCSQLLSIRKERVATNYRGILVKNSSGKLQLSNMEVEKKGLYESLLAVIGLEFLIKNRDSLFGQDVLVSGLSRCLPAFRNPARMKDFIYLFQRSRILISIKELVSPQFKRDDFSLLRAIAGFVAYLSQRFTLHLEHVFKGYPGLLAFELAVWTGKTEGLPAFFKTFYKEGGLLQVLALSGQHVAAMVLVFGFFLRMGFKFFFSLF